jgi:hypothetical protein
MELCGERLRLDYDSMQGGPSLDHSFRWRKEA